MPPTYYGSCHCGAVRFEVVGEITELTTCDCSLCSKKNALMSKVPESQFRLVSDWSALQVYQWNTRVAQHWFCKPCGIYTFHRKRAQPDWFGFNIRCLDNFDPSSVPVRATQGANKTIECSVPRDEWPGPRVTPTQS